MEWPSSSSEQLNDLLRMVANACMFPTFVAPPIVFPCSPHSTRELNDHIYCIVLCYILIFLLCNQLDIVISLQQPASPPWRQWSASSSRFVGTVQHSGLVIGEYTLLIGSWSFANCMIHKNRIRISDFIGSINQPSSLSIIGIQQLTFWWYPIPWWSCTCMALYYTNVNGLC